MRVLAVFAAVAAVQANPLPQGVTQNISPQTPAPAGNKETVPGSFGISVVQKGAQQAGSMTPVKQIGDGQVQAPTGGQTPAPSGGSGYPSGGAPGPQVSQIPDGQIQSPKGPSPSPPAPAPQPSSPPAPAPPAPYAPPPQHPQVTQIPDGQIQSPKGPAPGPPAQAPYPPSPPQVTQIPDGQIQSPKGQPPSSGADDCAKDCANKYDACRVARPGGQSSNQAQCAADYAACLNFNPFTQTGGTFSTPTACSKGGQPPATAPPQPEGPKVTQIPDGQIQAPKGPAPAPQPPSPAPQPPALAPPAPQPEGPKVTQIPDGQIQSPKGPSPAPQPPAPAPQPPAPAPQPPAPAPSQPSGPKVSQIPDGQIQAPKPPMTKRQACNTPGTLSMTLKNGVLKDSQGRTGYIAANRQFQFDAPAQTGAIYTSGWSVSPDGSLALGSQKTFYRCASGDFYNLYDEDWAEQCEEIVIQTVPNNC